jgi:hypothetical protein
MRFAARSTALALAPITGWAIQNVLALPFFYVVGMSRSAAFTVALLSLCAAACLLRFGQDHSRGGSTAPWVPLWVICGAAVLSLGIMAAAVPKATQEGIALSEPIFDHSKVAIIDEMVRSGVPPTNPYFAELGGPQRLSYYYLWHFSAAELALLTGVNSWEADAALTWFTAFASLSLMMGLAGWMSGRRTASAWVLVLAATGSLRPVLNSIFGATNVAALAGWPTGFGGWAFQSSWAPQHLASATCAVLAVFLLGELAQRPRLFLAGIFALLGAACFESSSWIGGVTFPLSVAVIGIGVIALGQVNERWRFAAYVALAALIALALASPFIYDQINSTSLRGDGSPIAVMPYPVLEDVFSNDIRRIFDPAAYWLVLLVVEFPALYIVGSVMMFHLLRDQSLGTDRRWVLRIFVTTLVGSLSVGWMLMSKVGENNDLAWRGVLPAVMLLIMLASVGISRYLPILTSAMGLAGTAIIALAAFDGAIIIYGNILVAPEASSQLFAKSASMWRAVQSHSNPEERIANNPNYLRDMTTWPVNISWALLSNRRSCYAGRDHVLPFSPLNRTRLQEVEKLFFRLFSGEADRIDVKDAAIKYRCRLVVITPGDGAWIRDVFQDSGIFELVDSSPSWRIYRVKGPAVPYEQN